MSPVLGIVTSTPQVSVALGDDGGGVIASLTLRQGRRHGETLAPAIESLCRLSAVALDQLAAVAVDTGPGLFTGLRVGVATAKALASALEIPVAVGCSLDLLARPASAAGCAVAAVVDARRGEVFWALYRATGSDLVAVSDPAVVAPELLCEALGDAEQRFGVAGPVVAVGDGARRYAEAIRAAGPTVSVAPESLDHPSAAVLVAMAPTLGRVEADKVNPNYMRQPDIRIGWEQRGG